jgi:hypothetical protein
MLNHVVLMKFKPDVGDDQIEALQAMFDDLPNKIIEIQTYEFGRDVVQGERSYDFGLVSLFANTDTLRRYQTHPEHLRVLETLKAMCESVITVDFFGTDAGSFKDHAPAPGIDKLFKG